MRRSLSQWESELSVSGCQESRSSVCVSELRTLALSYAVTHQTLQKALECFCPLFVTNQCYSSQAAWDPAFPRGHLCKDSRWFFEGFLQHFPFFEHCVWHRSILPTKKRNRSFLRTKRDHPCASALPYLYWYCTFGIQFLPAKPQSTFQFHWNLPKHPSHRWTSSSPACALRSCCRNPWYSSHRTEYHSLLTCLKFRVRRCGLESLLCAYHIPLGKS